MTSVSRPALRLSSSIARWLAEPIVVAPKVNFCGFLRTKSKKILEVVGRHARGGAHDQGTVGEQHDRREVLHHVIRHILVEERIIDVNGGRKEERVTIGSGLGDRVGADRSGCS